MGESMRLIAPTLSKVGRLGLLVASFCAQPVFVLGVAAEQAVPLTTQTKSEAQSRPGRVDFERESASAEARQVADWVVDSGDNHKQPFVIVDKANAKVFVFYADGRLRGAASALLGLAVGDDSTPGIGKRKMSSIRPDERTTPAGRFEAALDLNNKGNETLWVDYDSAISLHPVVTSNALERRSQRLETPSPLDNRISYGCINVPADFFKDVVSPAFTGINGIAYVLPETRSLQQVFALDDSSKRARVPPAAPDLPAPVLPQKEADLATR